jgi:hypothetical protein
MLFAPPLARRERNALAVTGTQTQAATGSGTASPDLGVQVWGHVVGTATGGPLAVWQLECQPVAACALANE